MTELTMVAWKNLNKEAQSNWMNDQYQEKGFYRSKILIENKWTNTKIG